MLFRANQLVRETTRPAVQAAESQVRALPGALLLPGRSWLPQVPQRPAVDHDEWQRRGSCDRRARASHELYGRESGEHIGALVGCPDADPAAEIRSAIVAGGEQTAQP